MIIQKATYIKGLENSRNEWIVTDIDNVMSMDKRHQETTINMIIDDIINSEIINVWFAKDNLNDLKLKRKKVIFSYGMPKEIIETVLIKDYSKIKNDSAIVPLNKYVNNILNKRLKRKLKKLVPKLIVCAAGIGILTRYVVLYTSDIFTNSNGINEPPEEPTISTEFTHETEPPIETSTETIDNSNEVVKPPLDILKEYCSIYGFDEYTINQIYNDNFDKIFNSTNIEETIMRCVYDFYTDNFYKKIPTQYNINTEDEMETFIVNYAYVLGIDNEEIIYTMLAIHELETGHGESEICLERNNLGGNIITDSETNESEFQFYPNAEVGAMDFVMDFYRIYKDTVPEELQNNNIDWNTMLSSASIEYYMNPVYCTEKMNEDDPEWHELVSEIKEGLKAKNRLSEINEMVNEYNSTSRIK